MLTVPDSDRPLPRVDLDHEQAVIEMIVGKNWRELAPDEWVARRIDQIPIWGWAEYRFPTPEFDAWLREVEQIVFDLEARERARKRYLSWWERRAASKRGRSLF